jgi:hypothetical protein
MRYDWRVQRFAFLALPLFTIALAGCGIAGGGGGEESRTSYPTEFEPEELDLEAMALRAGDIPVRGLDPSFSELFNNEEWAFAFQETLPEVEAAQKQIQLEAQGRQLGHLSFFAWDFWFEHLGRVQQIESHSTIYLDEEAASNALRFHACGLLIADDQQLDEFEVPRLGSESTGFFSTTTFELGDVSFGQFIETVVCFRTGRVVHAVVQGGLDGTQDTDLGVVLAERMLTYVNATFDGEEADSDDS